jgi:tetratricopeptide (TPR) repeat protein
MTSWFKKLGTKRAGLVALLCIAYGAGLGYLGRAYVADRCFRQGLALEKQGQWLEAVSSYEKALSINQENIWYYERLGQLYVVRARFPLEREGFVAHAQETLGKGLALCPGNGALWLSLAMIAAETGERKKASGFFDKAISCDPHNAFYHAAFSVFWWRQSGESEALAEARKAFACCPAQAVSAALREMGAEEVWIKRLREDLDHNPIPGKSS